MPGAGESRTSRRLAAPSSASASATTSKSRFRPVSSVSRSARSTSPGTSARGAHPNHHAVTSDPKEACPTMEPPDHEDELVRQRRRKLDELRARGIEPYPASVQRSITDGEAVARFEELADQDVSVVGRIVGQRRIMGKLAFCHIADGTGSVQLMLRENV